MAEFSSEPLAGIEAFRDVRDAYFNRKLDELAAAGISLDVLQDPEVLNELRTQFAKFAFEGMGPGSEFNYDTYIVSEGLRQLGFSDIVMPEAAGPPLQTPTRREMSAELAAEVAAQMDKSAESAEHLQARIRSAGAREAFPRVPMSAFRELPAAVGTAIQQIESIPLTDKPNPFFDLRAQQDPQTFQKAVALSIPSFDLPGVKGLTDRGVPHWLADIAIEDTLDPSSWIGGKPLAIALGVGAAALSGRLLFKSGRAMLRNGTRVTGDALVDFTAKLTRPFEEALATRPNAALLEPDAVMGFAEMAEPGPRKKALEKFSALLESGRGGTAEGRMGTDGKFFGIVKRMYDDGLEGAANELLDLRVALASTPEEMANLQLTATRALGADVNPALLKRSDIKEVFFDTVTGNMVEVDAGLVGRYIRNPEDFMGPSGKWLKNANGRAMKALFGEEADVISRSLVPVGQTRAVRESASGLEWALRNAPRELVDSVGSSPRMAGLRKVFAPGSVTLQRSPVFRPLVWAANARAAERGAWNLRLHDALGGQVHNLGEALTDIAFTNGAAVKLTKNSPLIPKNRSMFSPGRLLDRAQRSAARDLNDQLVVSLGDDLHFEAVNTKRLRDGLNILTRETADQRVQAMAQQTRLLFDALGEESKRLGIVDPRTLLNNYLPRIYRSMDQGLSVTDAIDLVRRGDGPVALEAEPFFSMLRSGENPEDLITDLPKLFERYVDTLTKHKYLKPVVNDFLEVLGSSSSGLSARDRYMALEFLHHQLGGVTRVQAKLAAGAKLANNSLEALADADRSFLRNFDAMIENGESVEGVIQWASRQLTDMLYTNFIGAKVGLPIRNLTQQTLGIPMVGGSVKGWDHMRRGTLRMMSDPALKSAYLDRARLWNWHNETFEFAEEAFGEFNKRFPDLIPGRWKRLTMGWYQLSDMQNRMNTWGAGYDYAEDVVRKLRDGKRPNWENSAAAMTVEERSALRRMVAAGDYDNFKTQYADAVVNNSQWLYNRKNRPLWAQDHPVLGTTLVFMTWPMNFAAAGWRASVGGKPLAALKGGAELARRVKRGTGYLMPMALLGGAMELGGRASGIGGMGDWLFPDISELPGGKEAKRDLGFEIEDKAIVPLPIKPLLAPIRTITGDEPLGGSLPVLRMWFEGGKAAKEVVRSIWSDENTEQRSLALQQFFKSFPVTQQGIQPLAGAVGQAFGIEADPEDREGIFEQVLGAILQVRESEGTEADIRRAQALPKVPGEQERFLLPVEGVR